MLSALGPVFVILVGVTAVLINFSLHMIEEGEQRSVCVVLTDYLTHTKKL